MSDFENLQPNNSSLTKAFLTDNPSTLMQYMVLESRMLQLEQARWAHRTNDIQMWWVNVEKVWRLSANSGYIIMTVDEWKNPMQTTNVLIMRDWDNLLTFNFPNLTASQAKEFNYIVWIKNPVWFKELKFLTKISTKESAPAILAWIWGLLDIREKNIKNNIRDQVGTLKIKLSPQAYRNDLEKWSTLIPIE